MLTRGYWCSICKQSWNHKINYDAWKKASYSKEEKSYGYNNKETFNPRSSIFIKFIKWDYEEKNKIKEKIKGRPIIIIVNKISQKSLPETCINT